MKKAFFLAIFFCMAAGCYAPLNNSGVSTTKAWLDIPAKKVDFEGKQYDSCYQFRLHFAPAEAANALDLQQSCIDSCCWRSDKEEIVLDFNKDFEKNLRLYGQAEKYTPGKITLRVSHSNLLNTTAVKVSPRGAVSQNGTVKLKKEVVQDAARLAQVQAENRRAQTRLNAWKADLAALQDNVPDEAALSRAQDLVQKKEGARIDRYFYKLNKSYSRQGYIYLLSQRYYTARSAGENTYRVTCRAKVQSGATAEALTTRTVSCGVWTADLAAGKVTPQDSTARRIKAKN